MNKTFVYLKLCFYLCAVLFCYKTVIELFEKLVSTDRKQVQLFCTSALAGYLAVVRVHLSMPTCRSLVVFHYSLIRMCHALVVFHHPLIRMCHALVVFYHPLVRMCHASVVFHHSLVRMCYALVLLLVAAALLFD